MAFSTQREFFPVPYEIETTQLRCKEQCMQVKSYGSTCDGRAWAQDVKKRSGYLSNLITWCKPPLCTWKSQNPAADDVATGNLTQDDTLNDANQDFQGQETTVQDDMQCEQFKNLIDKKFDKKFINEISNKIERIIASKKLSGSEENDLKCFQRIMKIMAEKIEGLEAQRTEPKINECDNLKELGLEPETSKNVSYLQRQVNCLRREFLRLCKAGNKPADVSPPSNPPEMQRSIEERTELRAVDQKIDDFQKRFSQAEEIADKLYERVECQAKYIAQLEEDLQNLQCYCEHTENRCHDQMMCLENRLEHSQNELCRSKLDAHKADQLQTEVICLRKQLDVTDKQLAAHELQFKQIQFVVKKFVSNGYRMCCRGNSGAADELLSQLSNLI